MKRLANFLASLPEKPLVLPALLAFLVLIFVTANLPWHLDNYDQAKQAYVAYEIVKTGDIWFQHTPQGASASKPPLMGWASAALRSAGLPWDLAWRLPSLLCALGMLGILTRAGRELLGKPGAVLAAAAFGLNLLTPRLATLVRTDMMLGFLIFLLGWMIWRKLRAGMPWTTAERWTFCAIMVAALMTKGPVIYAFLLPGLILFILIDAKNRRLAWSGWWTWVLPLALFLAWGATALMTNDSFYDDVVNREFLSRFQEGSRDDERPQPLWFYFPHLLHKFAPWSVLLLAMPFAFPVVRRNLRARPATLWLLLWALGGLLVMTLIPAKRVDRIYPVVPPLCLLLVDWVALIWGDRRVRIASGAALAGGFLFAGGYFVGLVPLSYHERTPALAEFAKAARESAAARGFDTITLPRVRDEGLLLYLDVLRFADKREAFQAWKSGTPMAILMSDRTARGFLEEVGEVRPALDSGELRAKNDKRYFLFIQD